MSHKIIKLHGCSGSGKTTVARAILTYAKHVVEVTPDGATKPEAYLCELPGYQEPVCVLGSYKNNCGGMDSFASDAPSIIAAIEAYHEMGHVFFEGLLLSTYYGTVGKHLEKYGDDFICAFLDTPILVCLERVTHRRDVNGSKNKFNPQNTIDKYNTIERLKHKCEAGGRRVYTFRHDTDPIAQINTLYQTGN